MERTFKAFHYLSYVQYPFLLMALYYCYKPLIMGINDMEIDAIVSSYNSGFLYLGVALSFTSLTDIRKRTKIGNWVFGKPKNAKRWIVYLCVLVVVIFAMGVFVQFFAENQNLKGLATGIFVLGIGVVGLLRMNLEIIKSYQLQGTSKS